MTQVIVLDDDGNTRRHVINALVTYALRRKRDRLPVPWADGGVQVTDAARRRPEPSRLDPQAAVAEPERVLLNLDDVATALRCGRRTVERLTHTGAIRTVHVGRSVRVRRVDLEQYIEGLATEGAP